MKLRILRTFVDTQYGPFIEGTDVEGEYDKTDWIKAGFVERIDEPKAQNDEPKDESQPKRQRRGAAKVED
jgi:hypothetical protein